MKKIILYIAALFLCGAMQAQSYHWSYNFHDYESNFPFIGEVYLDGVALASSDFEIAAFVGDQVRATEFLFEADPSSYPGRYYAWLGVAYNNAGETVTFKLYDHSTGTEYDNCSTTVLTNADGYGETLDPVVVEFTTPVSYGPEYPWIPGNYENYMYLETQIQINGVDVTNTNWEVGAFCGDECRGLGDADNWWVSPIDQSNILEIVVGGATGDVINFYLYDVTNQEVYPALCAVTLDWIDGDIGDIYDGLFVLNFVTMQTFTKDIAAYTENGGYYLIASPIGEVSPEDVTDMLSNEYDLYYFDQSVSDNLEWINYKGDDGNFNLVPGKGYLYADSANVTLTFTGFPYQGDGQVTLTKVDGVNFSGWNLVGNPFAQTAFVTKPYYTMNNDGSEVIAVSGNSVEAMEGIFVIAVEDGETMTFSTEEPDKQGVALVMSITQNRGTTIDRAIIRFGEEITLPKFMINENNTKVYIPQDDKDYAVVSVSSDMGEMPVNFKASENGTYTLAFNCEEVSFSYLHLIDNLTGADIDLLVPEPVEGPASYTFTAKTTDYASRFKLVFVCGDGLSTDSEAFAFMSNGNWIINNDGDAILQVIDVTGRMLSSEEIHGCYSKHIEAASGVYMLRLINGTDVKVQKVIVK